MKDYTHIISTLIWALAFVAFNPSTKAATCDSDLPEFGSRDDILIIVNDNSLASCEVGRHYAIKRDLGTANIAHAPHRQAIGSIFLSSAALGTRS